MLPIFAHLAGLWVLLCVPALLAIHFLQQRARVARTSTWFLIEKLSPDSARGRTWDRLRTSRTLWLQFAAVILAAWILGEPRWLRTDSAQTVVIVLDASASMEAFRAPALQAAEREFANSEGLASRTTWIVMTTNPRQPPLYRGLEREKASGALSRWHPELGRHDLAPSIRLARSLAGGSGRTLLITDVRAKVPTDQRAVGVGQPIDNVGFVGATVSREGDQSVWRALVRNHSASAQLRTWKFEYAAAQSPPERIELAPGALMEISGRFPAEADRLTISLSEDGFPTDNRLPLLVPKPKPLQVSIDGKDESVEFFRKLARAVDGVTVVGDDSTATLRIARFSAAEVTAESRGGIFWPPADRRAEVPLHTDPVTPERDPLMAGLNWQGWLGTGPHGFIAAASDIPLLWQGRWPLMLVRPPKPFGSGYEGRAATAGRASVATAPVTSGPSAAVLPANPDAAQSRPAPGHRKLLLAFDWATSNAARLPATVLLVRRFLETERDAQRLVYTANFDAGAPIGMAGFPLDGEFTVTFESAVNGPTRPPPEIIPVPASERSELRAPGRIGFFTVRRGEEVLLHGSTQFADARQGDFRTAERFSLAPSDDRVAALERNTASDPFVVLWYVLVAACVLGSWWTQARSSGPKPEKNAPHRGPEVSAAKTIESVREPLRAAREPMSSRP